MRYATSQPHYSNIYCIYNNNVQPYECMNNHYINPVFDEI